MNSRICVRRPRTPRSITLRDLAGERLGIPEQVARRATFRILVAMRARHAKLCELPGTSDAFERLMVAIQNDVAEA